MATTICEVCGHELHLRDFPFCPHGPTAAAIVRDEIPGGQIFENGFDVPTRFDSHSAHRAALAERGLEIRAKYAGPHDRYLTNWAAGIDAGTLENAATLVSRGTQARENRKAELVRICAEYPVTVTPLSEVVR